MPTPDIAPRQRYRPRHRQLPKDTAQQIADAHQAGIKPGAPSIGLVLGSGAARGFAHIGVMRALMAHGIKPDIIVGTSMGALVGGCYATGQLDTLEAWARSLTMRRVFGYLDVKFGGRPDLAAAG